MSYVKMNLEFYIRLTGLLMQI